MKPDRRPPPFRVVRATRLAFAFLTVIPLEPRQACVTEADLAASRYAYPLAGAAIGLMLAALSTALLRLHVEPGLAAFTLLVAWVLVTGGLHLDGLADSCDGLFLWGDPDRRLAAMRDPHVGSYGVSAIVLVLLGKYAALAHLAGPKRSLGVLAAAAIARTLILVGAGLANYARPDGTGRIVVDATTPRDALGAALLAVTIGAGLLGRAGLLATAIALMFAIGVARMSARKLGGITGDTLGALVELGEMAFLLVFAMF